jgi:hypothetical protein
MEQDVVLDAEPPGNAGPVSAVRQSLIYLAGLAGPVRPA